MTTAIAITDKDKCLQWFDNEASSLVEALPMTIPDADLKRSASRLRVFFAGIEADSKVWQCEASSIKLCIVKSAMTGFFPGSHRPDVDLIPRKGKLEWQMSYRGYIRACRRTPGWDVESVAIFKGDHFERGRSSERGSWYEYAPGDVPTGNPKEDWEAIRGVLIVVSGPEGREKVEFLTRGQIEQRKREAQTPVVWNAWPIEQAIKTGYHWAGSREMFPTDDPTRYAFDHDDGMRANLKPFAATAERPDPEASVTTPAVTDVLEIDGLDGSISCGQFDQLKVIIAERKLSAKALRSIFVALDMDEPQVGMAEALEDLPADRFNAFAEAVKAYPTEGETGVGPPAANSDVVDDEQRASLLSVLDTAGLGFSEVKRMMREAAETDEERERWSNLPGAIRLWPADRVDELVAAAATCAKAKAVS